MTRHQKQRLHWIGLVSLIGVGVGMFVFSALQQSMMYFMTPTELLENRSIIPTTRIRLGGVVERGSLNKESSTLTIQFRVTDFNQTVPVTFTGITPDLFKEGGGVVAEGHWMDGLFKAETVLAKHDENYRPPDRMMEPR
jgi:cytochrome c-type biogenesis protein CcmE